MSKWTNTLDSVNPAKCAQKLAGFHVTQSSAASTPEPYSASKSAFVTITHPDEQCGTLTGQTQVLSSTPDPPQQPSTSDADFGCEVK